MIQILHELENLAEEDYKAFNKRIIPTKQKVLGVRVPTLRKIAKKIVKEEPGKFIDSDKKDIYELIMLEGMVLSYLDKKFVDLLPLTEKFLKKVDNWAQVDSTICDYKNIKKQRSQVLGVVERWLVSEEEFVVRAALVILLAHFVEEKYLSKIFELSQQVSHQGYYVHMANAWLISVCMAKFPLQTMDFLTENGLDDKTHNKAIQKSRESFRVSKEHKVLINQLKKK